MLIGTEPAALRKLLSCNKLPEYSCMGYNQLEKTRFASPIYCCFLVSSPLAFVMRLKPTSADSFQPLCLIQKRSVGSVPCLDQSLASCSKDSRVISEGGMEDTTPLTSSASSSLSALSTVSRYLFRIMKRSIRSRRVFGGSSLARALRTA